MYLENIETNKLIKKFDYDIKKDNIMYIIKTFLMILKNRNKITIIILEGD